MLIAFNWGYTYLFDKEMMRNRTLKDVSERYDWNHWSITVPELELAHKTKQWVLGEWCHSSFHIQKMQEKPGHISCKSCRLLRIFTAALEPIISNLCLTLLLLGKNVTLCTKDADYITLHTVNSGLSKQEALQMQRDRVTYCKCEILHLKRLAIGEWPQEHLRSSQLLLLDRPYTSIISCSWPVVTSLCSTISEILILF